MPIRGMYDTWISGSDVNSFCCYGLVYLLDSWWCLRSLIEVHLHLHLHTTEKGPRTPSRRSLTTPRTFMELGCFFIVMVRPFRVPRSAIFWMSAQPVLGWVGVGVRVCVGVGGCGCIGGWGVECWPQLTGDRGGCGVMR